MGLPHVPLILNIVLLSQNCVQLEHRTLQLDNGLLAIPQARFKIIDFSLIARALLFHLLSESFLMSGHLVDVLLLSRGHLPLERLDVRLQ